MRVALAIALTAALPPSVHPWPIGVGARYHPAAPVRDGRPVGALRCGHPQLHTAVHVEVFAARRVVIVPAGIGRGPSCRYPLTTTAPTGVVHVGGRATIADLFHVWGARLASNRLLSFRGRVLAFVDGRRVRNVTAIPLTPHAEIVLEVGGYVSPHPSYLFPKGTP